MSTLHEQARAEAEKRYPSEYSPGGDRARFVEGFLAGHEAASRPREVTTEAVLAKLSAGTILLDSMGDVGRVGDGVVRYEETTPLSFAYVAKRYLPARVLYVPEEES